MKSWFPHGFCFVLVNSTKSNFGNLPPKFIQYQWTVTLKADVQEEEIWKKKLLGEVAGGVGEMAFLISFSKMFPEFWEHELTEKKPIFLFVPREKMSPVSIFPPLLRICAQQLFTSGTMGTS